MSDHYAVCLSVSQGAYDARAGAHLLYASKGEETMMHIEWPTMPAQPDPENPGEWLFNVLSDLVANFDAHAVTSAERKPRTVVPGGPLV
jgi:hypothetical protein